MARKRRVGLRCCVDGVEWWFHKRCGPIQACGYVFAGGGMLCCWVLCVFLLLLAWEKIDGWEGSRRQRMADSGGIGASVGTSSVKRQQLFALETAAGAGSVWLE